MHLLTWHGTVICLPDAHGAITHLKLPLAPDAPGAMDFEASAIIPRTQYKHPQLGILHVEAAPHKGGLHLFREGRYVCAEAYAPPLKYDRGAAGGWETFLPVSAQGLADLQHILSHRWIERATRRVIRRKAVRVNDGFVLRLGEYEIALGEAFAAALVGRSQAGQPARLVVAQPGEVAGEAVELVIAEPRSSALIDTALWPVRARRTAEILALAAHRYVIGLEPSQGELERDTQTLLKYRGVAGLADLLEDVDALADDLLGAADDAPPKGAQDATQRDDVLMAWAQREMAPWLLTPVGMGDAAREFEELNVNESWAFVYDFVDGNVTLRPKPDATAPTGPDSAEVSDMLRRRAQAYLVFFRASLRLLPDGFTTTLCIGLRDALVSQYGVPVFCFQKQAGEASVLLPDVDLLSAETLTGLENTDTLPYDAKTPTAVFVGSTTGGTITAEVARACALPRLRAARYFTGHPKVDFGLPKIVQHTEGVDDILRGYAFCQAPRLNWQQQFQHRFILSMDGNGATCSRVAIALNSNSVLFKYDSPNLLFYFGGLQPWLHYVPIAEDREVERIIGMEALAPEKFRRIADNGHAFAQTYLSEAALLRYTAMLLQLYASALGADADAEHASGIPRIGKSAGYAAATSIVAHVQDLGDVTGQLDTWSGERASGSAVEGFAIFLAENLPKEQFFYQAVLEDGSLSEPAGPNAYCGTRGEALPIYGLCITTRGAFAELYEVIYEAAFVDGSRVGPVVAGTVCQAETAVPLEAFRISIKKHVLSFR